MKIHRYVTQFADIRQDAMYCELVHVASSLPEAIKDGRAHVRDLNRSLGFRPGVKRFYYVHTYRAR